MIETPLERANSANEASMSTIVLAASALATICDSLLNGHEDEYGSVRVSKDRKEGLTFLASHFYELVKWHYAIGANTRCLDRLAPPNLSNSGPGCAGGSRTP
jgi:hypothetical protein